MEIDKEVCRLSVTINADQTPLIIKFDEDFFLDPKGN
jgi:hypothetical protein